MARKLNKQLWSYLYTLKKLFCVQVCPWGPLTSLSSSPYPNEELAGFGLHDALTFISSNISQGITSKGLDLLLNFFCLFSYGGRGGQTQVAYRMLDLSNFTWRSPFAKGIHSWLFEGSSPSRKEWKAEWGWDFTFVL